MFSELSGSGGASSRPGGRQHYGIAEIADSLGVDRQLVTVWRRRRSRGIPEPDDELAAGPLWLAATIEPWISATRRRLAMESPGAEGKRSVLPAQALRRYLRLTALLLEEQLRPGYVGRAARDLGELVPALEQLVADDATAANCLDGLVELARVAGHSVSALSDGDEVASGDLLRHCIRVLPELAPLGELCLEVRPVPESDEG